MTYEVAVLLGAAPGDSVFAFEERLRASGVRVDVVRLGMEVIERALFNRYGAVVLDASLTMIEPLKVRELLRHNPRTQVLPLFLVDFSGNEMLNGETNFIKQPLAGLGWLEAVLPQRARDSSEIEGTLHADLAEIPLPDLLQMLAQNRRRGVLEVEEAGKVGRIELLGEEIGGVQIEGGAAGLKALVRIQGWTRGKARFQPQPALKPKETLGHVTTMLVESLRLRDEELRWRARIPVGSRIAFRARRDAAPPADPLHEQILLMVDFFGVIDDILERLDAPDAAVLGGIEQLAAEGWVEVLVGGEDAAAASAEWHDLDLPTYPAGVLPQVWLFGYDAQFARLLWSEPRFQRRLITRRSLRSSGRFGGNGWVVDAGGGAYVWLRWSTPDAAMPAVVLRDGTAPAGVLMLVGEADGEFLESFRSVAQSLVAAGVQPVWLPVEAGWSGDGMQTWRDEFWATLPGKVLPPPQDPLGAFWEALSAALQAGTA